MRKRGAGGEGRRRERDEGLVVVSSSWAEGGTKTNLTMKHI